MNKKRVIGIALIIAIFIGLAATIVYIFTELKDETDIQIQTSETTDAKKFKTEYEDLNGKEVSSGVNYRTLSIDENNPIKYSVANDIVTKMNNNESFIVYFGFSDCPWCRSIIESLLDSAKDYGIDTIYYVDIKNIRDKYELDTVNYQAIRTVEGTDGYYALLNKLDSVLDDYEPLKAEVKEKGKKKKTITINVEEKRINAPSVILVKNGTPVLKTTGIPTTLTNPYSELTDDMKNYSKEEFGKIFEEIKPKTTTTESNICTGQSNC